MNKLSNILFETVQHIILLSLSFIASIPLISCVMTSLKTTKELANNAFFEFPEQINLQNYKEIIQNGYWKAICVTGAIILVSLIISSLLNAMTAYVLCRFNFRLKKYIYALIVFSSFIPSMTMQIFVFKMMAKINLVNSLIGYIVVISGIDIVSVVIFSRYFSAIPTSVDEAALIDGSSHCNIFFRIHTPLLRQAFLTSAIIRGIYVYNEYYIANLYLIEKSKFQTVTTLLYSFSAPFGTQYNIICAGVILAALPTILIFVIFQKRIYNGLAASNKFDF